MRNIDVITSQNVTINYEVAGTGNRFLASLIDIVIYFLFVIIMSIFLRSFGNSYILVKYLNEMLILLGLLNITIQEILMNGQSFGKKIMKIKIIKLDGSKMYFSDYIMRWITRMVDIGSSFGLVGVLLISSSQKGQRLGDVFANTTVIKLKANERYKLADILKLKTADSYEAQYPEVSQMSEREMLLIKEMLYRANKYQNSSYKNIVYNTAHQVANKLNITEVPKNKTLFLKQLINDFVAITR